jgi:hypothetical protein
MLISASDICNRSWPSTWPTTTDDGPIAVASSTRPGPTILSPTSPTSGSSADPFSAASSTNTSGPHRSQGQDEWPSSGTPQALARPGRGPSGGPGRAPGSGHLFRHAAFLRPVMLVSAAGRLQHRLRHPGHADRLRPRLRHARRRRRGLPGQPEHHDPPVPLPPVTMATARRRGARLSPHGPARGWSWRRHHSRARVSVGASLASSGDRGWTESSFKGPR